MSAITQELEKKLKEWPAATAHRVEQRVAELIAEVEQTDDQVRAAKTLAERARDPLFADKAIWHGPTPRDLSANHDKYLYDEEP